MNKQEFREEIRARLLSSVILEVVGMSKPNAGQGFSESRPATTQRGERLVEMLYSDPPEGGIGDEENTAIDG